MANRVIDTNVAVVANGRNVTATATCQEAAIDVLVSTVNSGRVVVDFGQEIISEYGKRLYAQGQPGVGDLFYRHILDNQGNAARVHCVDVSAGRAVPLIDAFHAGELSKFDPSDRIFALCSAVGRVPVHTATDSDWIEHELGLAACGVRVEFVCGRPAATKAR